MSKTNDYPKSSTITVKTSSNTFTYKIIQEGIYPSKEILVYTSKPNQYRILHNYIVETTYGRGKLQRTITCSIQYEDNMPVFKIEFLFGN
ncbi:11611_t:CDS:1, partial [Racocetra persica]